MKNGIINEIERLRANKQYQIDYYNRNRYRLVVNESDGSYTAYWFSTPIYNNRSRKLLSYSFQDDGAYLQCIGSNCITKIENDVRMDNDNGYCRLSLGSKIHSKSDKTILTNSEILYPSSNGVAYRVRCSETTPYKLRLSVGQPFLPVRENNKCFALMQEKFKPFVSVSLIGTTTESGAVIAPAKMSSRKMNDREYELTISPCSPTGNFVLFEANLYEPKLFQDTTVESANPHMNNAYGGIAFIGNTTFYGEQWLYTRPDFTKLQELLNHRIEKAILHLPKFNTSEVPLSGYGISARFCSFGSNWDNKIPIAALETNSGKDHGYVDLDITHLLTEPKTKLLKQSEGLIIRTSVKGSGFSAVATGDNYYAPQILEVNFR